MQLDHLDEIQTGAGSLVQWHLEEAEKAEMEALVSAQPHRRQRLLSAARYHRSCASDCAALEELDL